MFQAERSGVDNNKVSVTVGSITIVSEKYKMYGMGVFL